MATIQSRSETSRSAAVVTPLAGVWWKIATGLLMAYVIYGAFFIAGGAVRFTSNGDSARIVFFHVPVAVSTSIWYFVGLVYAVRYLFSVRHRSLDTDAKAAICMEMGFLFCVLATITGSIFANAQWGSFWNWDARETSIVIMLLLYTAYLVLRGAMAAQPEKRARLSAVYAIVGWVPAIFLIWIMPRLPRAESLHPQNTLFDVDKTSLSYKAVLYPSFLAFTMLFVWLFQLRFRLYKVTQSQSLENSVAQIPPTVGQ